MLAYAHGYASCLPRARTASIELARGTSNYHPAVPSAYKAGVSWARETNALAHAALPRAASTQHVEAAAADDAEPAWDPGFRRTRDFFHGFRAAGTRAHALRLRLARRRRRRVWSARQAWYVAGGIRYTRAMPGDLQLRDGAAVGASSRGSRAAATTGRSRFAGVMTQGTTELQLRAPARRRRTVSSLRALDAQGVGRVPLRRAGAVTNIVG